MTESMDMAVCPKCGGKNPPDSRFCGYCGTVIPQESEEKKGIIPEAAEPAEADRTEAAPEETEASPADASKAADETESQQPQEAEENIMPEAAAEEPVITPVRNAEEDEAQDEEPAAGEDFSETAEEPETENPEEPTPVRAETEAENPQPETMAETKEDRVVDAEFAMKEEKPVDEQPAAAEAPKEKKVKMPKINADFSKSPLNKNDFSVILSSLADPLKQIPFTMTQSVLSLILTLLANMFLFTGILRAAAKKMINTFGLYAEIAGYGSFSGSGSDSIYGITAHVRFADRFMSGLLFTLIMIALMAAASAFGQYRENRNIDAKQMLASAARSLAAPALLVIAGSILAGFLPTIAMVLYLTAFITSIMAIQDKLPRSWNGWLRIVMIVLIAGIILWAGADGFIRVFLSTASQFASAAEKMFRFR